MSDLNVFEEVDNPNAVINKKLRQYFDGKIVRKDLTKSINEGANVPIYVLEFLLGQYCSSDDPDIIEEGVIHTVFQVIHNNVNGNHMIWLAIDGFFLVRLQVEIVQEVIN